MTIEKSIKQAAENKESWSIGNGYYHGWSCDDVFYKKYEKEIDKLTRQFGFIATMANKSGKPIKMHKSDKYYTPMTWIKNANL